MSAVADAAAGMNPSLPAHTTSHHHHPHGTAPTTSIPPSHHHSSTSSRHHDPCRDGAACSGPYSGSTTTASSSPYHHHSASPGPALVMPCPTQCPCSSSSSSSLSPWASSLSQYMGLAGAFGSVGLLAFWEQQNAMACTHLLASPLTTTALLTFNVRHAKARHHTIVLATVACLLGNAGAVGLCARVSCAHDSDEAKLTWELWLLSAGIGLGAAQLLLLTSKRHVVSVMLCTACAVIILVLTAAAPFFASRSLQGHCYQSTVIPLLWLFWQASCALPCHCKLDPSHQHQDVMLAHV